MHRPLRMIGSLLVLLVMIPWISGPTSADEAAHTVERQAYRSEPVDLGPGGSRVGELIDDVTVTPLDAVAGNLSDHLGEKGLVIAVRDALCPLSRKYGPRLARLEKEYGERGFGFLYVNPNAHDTPEEMRQDAARHGFAAPYAADAGAAVSKALDARISTEVFVLDAARTLVYRGAIDDQYGLGYTKPEPKKLFLRRALDAVATGGLPEVRATTASGCAMSYEDFDEPPTPKRQVTYHNRISRIVQNRCQSCHRAGGAGPFELAAYDDLKGRSMMIEVVLEERIMPPFYVDDGYGPWANDMRLSGEERGDFLAWIAAGAPQGDPADQPVPRRFADGWTIGEPDYVARMPEPFEVPAEGAVRYQYFFVQTELEDDKWIQAMEIRSSAPEVVHHVLVFLESPEVLQKIRQRRREVENPWSDPEFLELYRQFQGGRHSYFASAVPGQAGITFPDGMGKKLPAGAWLKFQLHYTPNGSETLDRSEIGFVFADGPVETEVVTSSAINEDFVIPAGASDHEVTAEFRFPEAAALLSLFPHTHLRGTRFLLETVYPDGRVETVLPLNRYDFNWQLNYRFQQPLEVPEGTVLRARAWYDNSARNPANPDPTVDVTFGEQTWDEMMIGYVNWVPVSR